MTFLQTTEGQLVPMTRVMSACYISEVCVEITVEGGATHECAARNWELARSAANRQVVPAAPGTLLLTYGRFDGRLRIDREPIVAWIVEPAGVAPVTATGKYSSKRSDRAVLYPDGRVHDSLGLHAGFRAWISEVGEGEVLEIDSGRGRLCEGHEEVSS